MQRAILFITGTDTGVGKTVLACLLSRGFRNVGVPVAALKPICSGDRNDARALRDALSNGLELDVINPWHFRAPIAPVLAARRERRTLKIARVLEHIRTVQKQFPVTIVEGAGGLLSPLGERFASLDLICRLRALPIVVCANRLGAINQTLLTLAALPPPLSRRAPVVLVSPKKSGTIARDNCRFLVEMLGAGRVHLLPWLPEPQRLDRALANRRVKQMLRSLQRACGLNEKNFS